MKTPADELIPTRQSLLSRLKDLEDHDGWKEFFDTYWRLIYTVALKAGLTESEAEEVVQETAIAVARQMPTFEYDKSGSFKGWLLQITRRRIADQFRKRPPWEGAPPSAGDASTGTPTIHRVLAPEPDLEPVWEEEWRKNLVDAAMQRVKARVTPRQYQIFDLYVVKGWPVVEVKRTLNVSAPRVYLAKHRISRLVREEMRRMEKQCGETKFAAPPTRPKQG
ncbi:MAG: sigma-70 family RNA polymerase sigma factor [Verrucomicrobia bacterium]|nr:sigma-70 family RNA polymerase sigma factor [Verrucomicrobiota bacterium]